MFLPSVVLWYFAVLLVLAADWWVRALVDCIFSSYSSIILKNIGSQITVYFTIMRKRSYCAILYSYTEACMKFLSVIWLHMFLSQETLPELKLTRGFLPLYIALPHIDFLLDVFYEKWIYIVEILSVKASAVKWEQKGTHAKEKIFVCHLFPSPHLVLPAWQYVLTCILHPSSLQADNFSSDRRNFLAKQDKGEERKRGFQKSNISSCICWHDNATYSPV